MAQRYRLSPRRREKEWLSVFYEIELTFKILFGLSRLRDEIRLRVSGAR